MKATLFTTVLAAAVSGVSAGVLVKRPAVSTSKSSSSVASSSTKAPGGSPCKIGNNGLYSCFRSSTDNALSYCSTAASVYLTGTTTTVLAPGTTDYVTEASETVTSTSTSLSVVESVKTTSTATSYSGVTSVEYTVPGVTQTKTDTVYEAKRGLAAETPAPTLYVMKRDGSGIEVYDQKRDQLDRRDDDDLSTVTVGVLKRTSVVLMFSTCTTSTAVTVTVERAKRTAAPRYIPQSQSSASASASSSASSTGNPPPACLQEIASPAASVLTSVCNAFVTAYGTTPSPVTDVLELPATTVTVRSGISTDWTVEQSTSTSTAFTVYQVTTVSTATISMCTVVTTTIYQTA
ncbi:hypothetical protein SEUCBS139899_009093 [Sporothrix eucalyptigena]|uniref:Uncharacterized protein n=1 Tax=Sporothrix eucalyptigena TaxID=1812306 RepID=A0ABP0CIE4_9PEZI